MPGETLAGGGFKQVFGTVVSSHELRSRYAQRIPVDERMNPHVVIQVGGWSSFQAIEHCLNAPTEAVVDDGFAGVEVA